MPSPGTYTFTIHPTDGSVEHTAGAELALSCCAYSYYIPSIIDCCNQYVCDTDLPCHPAFFSYAWSIEYYDSCGNLMSTETGTVTVGYDCSHPGDCQAAYMVFGGDTIFTDPDGGVHNISDLIANCGCL